MVNQNYVCLLTLAVSRAASGRIRHEDIFTSASKRARAVLWGQYRLGSRLKKSVCVALAACAGTFITSPLIPLVEVAR